MIVAEVIIEDLRIRERGRAIEPLTWVRLRVGLRERIVWWWGLGMSFG
jgi:hypothetical protein